MPGQGPSTPRHVPKPWGSEEIWAETDAYIGKILTIRQGHRLSLQHHAIWRLVLSDWLIWAVLAT